MKENEAKAKLEEYFGKHEKRLEVIQVGDIIAVNVEYYDFKPKSQVMKDMIAMVPMIDIGSVERIYSPEAIGKALFSLYDKDTCVWIEKDKDKLERKTLGLYIEEQLHLQDLRE